MAGQIVVQRGTGTTGGGGGTPGGANTQVQYNDGGAFGGDAGLTFDETNDLLTVVGGLDIDSDTSLLRLGGSQDVVLARDAANALAQRNGTNAQTLRAYETFTDSSNYKRLSLNAGTRVAERHELRVETAGTGGSADLWIDANRALNLLAGANQNVNIIDANGLPYVTWELIPSLSRHRVRAITGQEMRINAATEETVITTSAFTDAGIQFSATSLALGVSVRVTTAIPTATTFDVGVSGATTRYGTGLSTAANTTNVSMGGTALTIYTSATAIRLTPNASPAANTGRVRVTIYYIDLVAPTS